MGVFESCEKLKQKPIQPRNKAHKSSVSSDDVQTCMPNASENEQDLFENEEFLNILANLQQNDNGYQNESNIVANNTDDYFTNQDLLYYSQKFGLIQKCESQSLNLNQHQSGDENKIKLQWEKGKPIGQGSFGQVFEAFNCQTGTMLAVKQKIESLQSEINILKSLQHENIVRYLDSEKTNDTFSIFLEYVEGGSISNQLEQFGKFSETLVRKYTKQILTGLEYLHWNKVVHRDIKGANVLVNKQGVCKLADFGSSKKIVNFNEQDKFKSLQGTAFWMAPEVIKQTGHGRFADIWSIGCTVIEMITGKPPFYHQYTNPLQAMFQIAKGKVMPLIQEGCLSEDGLNFVQCCLKICPKERFNVRQLLQHPFIVNEFSPTLTNQHRLSSDQSINSSANEGGLIEQQQQQQQQQQKCQSSTKQNNNSHTQNQIMISQILSSNFSNEVLSSLNSNPNQQLLKAHPAQHNINNNIIDTHKILVQPIEEENDIQCIEEHQSNSIQQQNQEQNIHIALVQQNGQRNASMPMIKIPHELSIVIPSGRTVTTGFSKIIHSK